MAHPETRSDLLDEARRTFVGLDDAIDEAELYSASRHPWVSGPLAEPVHECLGGHYEWAIGAIAAARD